MPHLHESPSSVSSPHGRQLSWKDENAFAYAIIEGVSFVSKGTTHGQMATQIWMGLMAHETLPEFLAYLKEEKISHGSINETQFKQLLKRTESEPWKRTEMELPCRVWTSDQVISFYDPDLKEYTDQRLKAIESLLSINLSNYHFDTPSDSDENLMTRQEFIKQRDSSTAQVTPAQRTAAMSALHTMNPIAKGKRSYGGFGSRLMARRTQGSGLNSVAALRAQRSTSESLRAFLESTEWGGLGSSFS